MIETTRSGRYYCLFLRYYCLAYDSYYFIYDYFRKDGIILEKILASLSTISMSHMQDNNIVEIDNNIVEIDNNIGHCASFLSF